MKYKIYLLFLIITFLCIYKSYAQESKKTKTISYMPYYLALSAIRFDFEIRKPDSNKWLVFAPQIYSGNANGFEGNNLLFYNETEEGNSDKVNGLGFNTQYKVFLSKNKFFKDCYIALDASYHYFHIDFQEYKWTPYTDQNIQYWDYRLSDQNSKINRFSLSGIHGYRKIICDVIFFDFFIGLGFKYSLEKSTSPEGRNFNRHFLDYAYKGVFPNVGVKFGVFLN